MDTLISHLLSSKNYQLVLQSDASVHFCSVYDFATIGVQIVDGSRKVWARNEAGLLVVIYVHGYNSYRVELHGRTATRNLELSDPIFLTDNPSLPEAVDMFIGLAAFDLPDTVAVMFRGATVNSNGLVVAPSTEPYSLMFASSGDALDSLDIGSQFYIGYTSQRYACGAVFFGAVIDGRTVNVGRMLDTLSLSEEEFSLLKEEAATFKRFITASDVVPGMRVSAYSFVYAAAIVSDRRVECLDAVDMEHLAFDRSSNLMALLDNTAPEYKEQEDLCVQQ